MTSIFIFTPKASHNSKEKIEDLSRQKDFQALMDNYIGTELSIEITPLAKLSEKERMYAYYHKVILAVAMKVFENDGWENVDKVKADYLLKAECAKEPLYNAKTDEETIFLLDKAAMNKERLRKYLVDCIEFLTHEKGANVPDSESYLFELKTGWRGKILK